MAEHALVMHAGLIRREKRTLVMKPDHARIDAGHGLYGMPGDAHFCGRVAEQRRQQRGRAEPPVRRRDGGNSVRGRVVVEQHVSAAIHLSVDEAGRQPGLARQRVTADRFRHVVPAHHRADPPVFDHHGAIVAQHRAVEDVVSCGRELHLKLTLNS